VRKLTLKEFEVLHTAAPAYPGGDAGKKWSVERDFKKKLRIKVIRREHMEMEFDMIGVDASLASAFRRLLISDVPTMAIEKVHIYNNTSIIQDEVFAHRLGLVPLKVDPRKFEWKPEDSEDEGTETDTLEFQLKVKCKRSPTAAEQEICVDKCVYSKHIKWIPRGEQSQLLDGQDPGPVEGDILLNKLLPGHELDIRLYAVKGVGRDHAKFSPVATAFYRLLPSITLKREVRGEAAERLKSCFSPGVIELEGVERRAVVKNARVDTCSRNVYRHEDLRDAVELTKVRDHFIFTVESTGALKPQELFIQAIDLLADKCDVFLAEFDG